MLLSEASWHFKHEDIVSTLDYLGDNRSVEALYAAALAKFDYLNFDEAYALAVKAIYALRNIGSPEAIEKLKILSESNNEVIAHNATKRLKEITCQK